MVHATISLKERAFIDYNDGCLNVPKHLSRKMNLDFSIGYDVAANLTADYDVRDMNIGINRSLLADNKGSFG
jgi:hypothetical protein